MLEWLGSAAGGALIGFLFSAVLQRAKSGRDELHVACGEFCIAISDAANLGAHYWLKPGQKDDDELIENEARIDGYQRRLSGYAALVRRSLHSEGGESVDAAATALFDALTGDEFRSPDRLRDSMRATLIQGRGADLILAVRGAFLDKMDSRRQFQRIFDTLTARRGLLFHISA
jgi:hypothetical protein